MSQRPISLSPDLLRLRAEGYDLDVVAAHLVVRDVPYLDAQRQIVRGTLVTPLTLLADVAVTPGTHVAYLAGPGPYDTDGRPLDRVVHSAGVFDFVPGVPAQWMLSHKPQTGYPDYSELVSTYTSVLGKHATAVDSTVSAQTFPVVEPDTADDGPFVYLDTASARAGITAVTARLVGQRLAVVGLGGTGAYVLDLLAKSPVAEIHLFDGDVLSQHNAFRYPGAVPVEALRGRQSKVDYLAGVYGAMRRGVVPHAQFVDAVNVGDLDGFDFVFLAVDDNPTRAMVAKHLEAEDRAFVDVGMGLYETDGRIGGQLRVTTSVPGHRDHLWDQRRRLPTGGGADDLYRRNVQIVDLNALNAALAVTRWKRHAGVFADLEREHHSVYVVDGNDLVNEDA